MYEVGKSKTSLNNDLDIEILLECVSYDPDTGELRWKIRDEKYFNNIGRAKYWNNKYAGQLAFSIKRCDGYVAGYIFSKKYLAHRVAWAIHYKKWPTEYLDHINGKRFDNRISNLRSVTAQQNTHNSAIKKNSSTGFKGVIINKYRGKKYHAQIRIDGKNKNLGFYDTAEEAHLAYVGAAKIYFGDYANDGTYGKKTNQQ